MSMFPVNRVPDILRRMDMNSTQAEAMKTCFGILAIMSREDSNKSLIARDGMETILNVMTAHIDRTDVQEAGCDLLWSLAFNSTVVKEVIAKFNGATVLVRALKRHSRSSDFLKSACGALSNICQYKPNQEGVASQGGLQPLVGSIHIHQSNGKLLPFIFDAIASIIVNNEDNARGVSALGIIPVIVSSLSRHKQSAEVVKSGCHTLAILSDVKGQASKIAFAGGVPVILSLLDAHTLYADLHRVAAVVLLRMLQESSHVGKEISCHEGVRILLNSLEKGGAQQDTVAAVTHILYTITNPQSPAFSSIEPQLWLRSNSSNNTINAVGMGSSQSGEGGLTVRSSGGAGGVGGETALGGLVSVLERYVNRRDVVRAGCRLLSNLTSYPHVSLALERLGILDRVFECVCVHKDTRDVLEGSVMLTKSIFRKKGGRAGGFRGEKGESVAGLLHVMRAKGSDEEMVGIGVEMLCNLLGTEGASKGWEKGALGGMKDILEQTFSAIEAGAIAGGGLGGGGMEIRGVNRSSPPGDKGAGGAGAGGKMSSASTISVLTRVVGFVEGALDGGRVEIGDASLFSLMEGMERGAVLWRAGGPAAGLGEGGREIGSKIAFLCQWYREKREGQRAQRTGGEERGEKERGGVGKEQGEEEGGGKGSSKEEGGEGERAGGESASPSLARKVTRPRGSVGGAAGGGTGGGIGMGVESRVGRGESSSSLLPYQMRNGKLFPFHPIKGEGGKTLLSSWPPYLERLSPSPSSFLSRPISSADSPPLRMQMVYESTRPGGRGLTPRLPTPLPYPLSSSPFQFEHSLSFDSEFESGNLYKVIQNAEASYDLVLRADVHTMGHTQWFYFSLSNTHPPELVKLSDQGVVVPPVRVRFNIINFTKPDSLFNLGMRPVVYSVADARDKGLGWIRAGSEISYYMNSYMRSNNAGEGVGNYYTLSFTLEFVNVKDTLLVAYSYPYTLTDYKQHMAGLLDKQSSDVIRKMKLCSTMGGEDCDLIVITDFKDKERTGPLSMASMDISAPSEVSDGNPVAKLKKEKLVNKNNYKPGLFLSGRVHPGETPASYMMQGILDFLVSSNPSAVLLRRLFVIFIVPILNPDGVQCGNNRCSLSGVDLNRQWKVPDKITHPTIYHLKLFMMLQKKVRDIFMFIDLHGHSRKYNVFMYGCDEKKNKPNKQVRAFPRYLSQHNIGGKYVCYEDCSFHVKKGRESTARVVVAKDMGIVCSFTLEATFCGSNYGPLKNCHMNIGHLLEVGAALCDAVGKFSLEEGYGKELTGGSLGISSSMKALALCSYEGIVENAEGGEKKEGNNGSGNGRGVGYGAGQSGSKGGLFDKTEKVEQINANSSHGSIAANKSNVNGNSRVDLNASGGSLLAKEIAIEEGETAAEEGDEKEKEVYGEAEAEADADAEAVEESDSDDEGNNNYASRVNMHSNLNNGCESASMAAQDNQSDLFSVTADDAADSISIGNNSTRSSRLPSSSNSKVNIITKGSRLSRHNSSQNNANPSAGKASASVTEDNRGSPSFPSLSSFSQETSLSVKGTTHGSSHTLFTHSVAGDVISNNIMDSSVMSVNTSSSASAGNAPADVIHDGAIEFLFKSKRNNISRSNKLQSPKTNSSSIAMNSLNAGNPNSTSRSSISAQSGEMLLDTSSLGIALAGNKFATSPASMRRKLNSSFEDSTVLLSRSFPINQSLSDANSVKSAPAPLNSFVLPKIPTNK